MLAALSVALAFFCGDLAAQDTIRKQQPRPREAPPADRPSVTPPAVPPKSAPGGGNAYPMLERLGWLAGSWFGENDAARFEEHWLPAAGGVMLGIRREVGKTGLGTFEYKRIQGLPSGAMYMASPGGRAPLQLPLAASEDGRAVFENPRDEYPKRITYWLEGDELHARIEGHVSGILDYKEWVFRRSDRGVRAMVPEPEPTAEGGR
jgi:hypothetical protein